MAKIDGNTMRIKCEGTLLGGTTSVSIAFSKDLQDVTTQDSNGNTEYEDTTGKIAAKGSFDGFYDPELVYQAEEIISNINLRGGFVTMQVGVSTGIYWEFEAMLSDLTVDTKNDTVPTIKGNYASSGVLTKNNGGTVPELISAATVVPQQIILIFLVAMNDPAAFAADFNIDINATPATITGVVQVDPATYVVQITESITTGQTVTVSIAAGNIKSAQGVPLVAIVDQAVTNSN